MAMLMRARTADAEASFPYLVGTVPARISMAMVGRLL